MASSSGRVLSLQERSKTDVLPESPVVLLDSVMGTEGEGNFDVPDLVSVLDGLRERVPSEQGRGSGSFASIVQSVTLSLDSLVYVTILLPEA